MGSGCFGSSDSSLMPPTRPPLIRFAWSPFNVFAGRLFGRLLRADPAVFPGPRLEAIFTPSNPDGRQSKSAARFAGRARSSSRRNRGRERIHRKASDITGPTRRPRGPAEHSTTGESDKPRRGWFQNGTHWCRDDTFGTPRGSLLRGSRFVRVGCADVESGRENAVQEKRF